MPIIAPRHAAEPAHRSPSACCGDFPLRERLRPGADWAAPQGWSCRAARPPYTDASLEARANVLKQGCAVGKNDSSRRVGSGNSEAVISNHMCVHGVIDLVSSLLDVGITHCLSASQVSSGSSQVACFYHSMLVGMPCGELRCIPGFRLSHLLVADGRTQAAAASLNSRSYYCFDWRNLAPGPRSNTGRQPL
jgi:hypothetical protein